MAGRDRRRRGPSDASRAGKAAEAAPIGGARRPWSRGPGRLSRAESRSAWTNAGAVEARFRRNHEDCQKFHAELIRRRKASTERGRGGRAAWSGLGIARADRLGRFDESLSTLREAMSRNIGSAQRRAGKPDQRRMPRGQDDTPALPPVSRCRFDLPGEWSSLPATGLASHSRDLSIRARACAVMTFY